ncbi:MAG: bifunctional adenosylcobinamide kinase/adenosylcobinamide-phosphate guanylyltransferase [Spirochaetes bacterium]|nr:bifunctional adenosylcobinamide kinase/adenosylcobinamide-phosphate guanylyltransferase [Spirochaetota bacterium]
MRTLITGGVKSGKSSRALVIARRFPEPRYFLATAEAFDGEMRERIARHKAQRPNSFVTIEEPLEIQDCLRENMILDCVTFWLNNMFHYGREEGIKAAVETLIARLPRSIVVVTNEVGMGIVPGDPLSRRYSETLGRVNAQLASACDEVVLMVAGLPLLIKTPE